LHQQAIDPKNEFGNSRVILCSGNHEFWYSLPEFQEVIIGDLYYHPYDYAIFGSPENRRRLLNSGGVLANKFAEILKAIVIVGDFIFLHAGLNTSLLRTYNFKISEFDNINKKLRDFFLEIPISTDEYNLIGSLLNFREDNTRNCGEFIDFIRTQLERPNLNMVVGHTADGSSYDFCNTHMDGIKSTYDINRINPDGTLKPCITLPVSLCTSSNNTIYKIDTHISRMSGTMDYRYPKTGSLNSLVIALNDDGTKKNVHVINSYLYNTHGVVSQTIERS